MLSMLPEQHGAKNTFSLPGILQRRFGLHLQFSVIDYAFMLECLNQQADFTCVTLHGLAHSGNVLRWDYELTSDRLTSL